MIISNYLHRINFSLIKLKYLMMKKLFTLLFVLCAVTFVSAQDIYYSENLDAGLPADWSVQGEWVIGTPAAVSSQFFTVPSSVVGNVACFNDDGLGNGQIGGGTIVTGMIDLTSVTGTLVVEMRSYFPNLDYQGLDETAKVSISTDNGMNWAEVLDITGGESNSFGVAFVDISSYAGSQVWLKMDYDDGATWNYGWAFDDLRISSAITLIDARSFRIHAGTSVLFDQALEGVEYYNSGLVVNYGSEPITSFDVTLSSGATSYTKSFNNVNIPNNGVARYAMDDAITVSGNAVWTVAISNVNGTNDPDANPADNSMTFTLNATNNVHPDKAVVVEEATGTWCTWCPRGAAYLDEMSKRFGEHFVGIAVHNSDPMELAAYDGAITSFPGFQGFPSVIYQREEILDPSEIVTPSLADMNVAPPAAVEVGAMLDGNALTTSVQAIFLEAVEADHNVAVVLIEDGMTGTSADWNQINAYGQGAGDMGGYELLPGNIPAELMVYDHVGRALIGGFDGANEVVGSFTAGQSTGFIFDAYTLPNDMNIDNVHIVGLLINSAGEIVNAKSVKLSDAVDNGLFVSAKDVYDNTLAAVYPNPVKNMTNIYMSLEAASNVSVSLVNTVGQTVAARDYGSMAGEFVLEYDMTGLNAGVYVLHITAGDKFITKKINKID
jgi:thiol-disulfide isomerase/thioredoxin